MSRKKQLAKNPPPPEPERRRFSIGPRLIVLVLVVASMAGFGYWVFADWYFTVAENTVSTYVGRQTCIQCHQHEAHEWKGSHHDKAMDLATDETVLGNFDNAEITYAGITSRFFKKGDKFFVNTEGPDGKMADFEIKYVFGVDPMQQYMVEFDRTKDMREDEIARVQVLRLSWDVNKKHWFYIPPPNEQTDEKLAPDDVLHWTGWGQCWNTMCANCHSTNLKKNYDHNKLMYRTTFSEIDVSCEACHGPGSTHVDLAESKKFFWDRKVGYGLAKLKSDDSDVEIHACAQCHARQRMLHPEFHPGNEYYDHFANELLSGMTYHADGQIMDEDYVFGSFIQSKMYHKGIRCSDCHNPHSLKLKHEGNKVCTSCHQHPAGKYDTPAHHFHKDGSTGASCVECHMPETTYMVIDPRRDHSMRVPRPDLSVEIGTPNACTRCHIKKDNLPAEKRGKLTQYLDWLTEAREGDETIANEIKRVDKWAADNFEKWYGKKDDLEDHFAVAFATIREGENRSPTKLIALAKNKNLPAIVRATALMELAQDSSEDSLKVAIAQIKDRNPQVRSSAIARLEADIRQLRDAFDSVDRVANQHRNAIRQLETHLQTSKFQGSSEGEPNQIVVMLRRQKEGLRQIESILRQNKKEFAKRVQPLLPLLDDSTRLVRTESARVLAQAPPELIAALADSNERKSFDRALNEYRESQLISNDRAGAHMMLGLIAESQRDEEAAEELYRTAMKVDPQTRGPRTRLARLLEERVAELRGRAQAAAAQRKRPQAESLMTQAFTLQQEAEELQREELELLARDARLLPNGAEIQFQYGLALSTQQRLDEAEKALLRAVELEPRNAYYSYTVALLYDKLERSEETEKFALNAAELDTQVAAYPYFVALLYRKLGRWKEAEEFVKRAIEIDEEDQSYHNLLDAIRNRVPAQEN